MSIHSTVSAKDQYPPKRTQIPQTNVSTSESISNVGVGRPHERGVSELTLIKKDSEDTEVNQTYELHGSQDLQTTVIQSKRTKSACDS